VRTDGGVPDSSGRYYVLSTLEEYTSFDNFEIVNIVAKGKLFPNSTINLAELSKNHIDLTGWDSETFPGLRFSIYRSPECPISVETLMAHVFRRSNDVIMKARTKLDIYHGHRTLKKMVAPYATPDEPVIDVDRDRASQKNASNSQTGASRKRNNPRQSSGKEKKKLRSSGGEKIFPRVSLSDLGLDPNCIFEEAEGSILISRNRDKKKSPSTSSSSMEVASSGKRRMVVRKSNVSKTGPASSPSNSLEMQEKNAANGPVKNVDDIWDAFLNGLFVFPKKVSSPLPPAEGCNANTKHNTSNNKIPVYYA
jgi:hypothetical protein